MLFKSKFIKSSDEELMFLIKKGNEKAFNIIYKRYSKQLHYFFYKMLYCDKDKADDFLQELFIRIYEKANQFHPEGSFKKWIYAIAANMIKNEYRKINTLKIDKLDDSEIDFPVKNETLSFQFDLQLFRDKLQYVVDSMETNDKLIFHLRFKEELTIPEIAEIVQIPEGTIKSKLFYILKKISSKLNGHDPR